MEMLHQHVLLIVLIGAGLCAVVVGALFAHVLIGRSQAPNRTLPKRRRAKRHR